MADNVERTALVIDARGASSGAAQFEAAAKKVEAASANIERATQRVNDATRSQERFLDSLVRKYDPAAAAAAKYAKEQARLQGIIAGGGQNSERAAQILSLLENRLKGVGVANDNAAAASKRFRYVMGQAGYQMGDIFTQLSMGQNAFNAVAVQLGQFLQFLGPWGIAASVAVTAAGALAKAFSETGDASSAAAVATDQYKEAMIAASALTLTEVENSRRLAEAKRDEAREKIANAIATQAEIAAKKAETLGYIDETARAAMAAKQAALPDEANPFGISLMPDTSALDRIRKEADDARANISRLYDQLDGLDRPRKGSILYNDLNKEQIKASEEAAKRAQEELEAWADLERTVGDYAQKRADLIQSTNRSVDEQIEALQRERAELDMTDRERQIYIDTMKAEDTYRRSGIPLDEQRIAQIKEESAALYDKRVAVDQAKQAMKDADAAEKAYAREASSFFDQSFNRIGTSITDMVTKGQSAFISLQNIGNAVVSELIQEFAKLALINPLKNAFGLNGGAALPVLGDITSKIGSFFGFASGTPSAPPGMAWVGERGPELVRFRGGEQVYPHDLSNLIASPPTVRGFADGAYALTSISGSSRPANDNPVVNVNIINNAGADVSAKQKTNSSGGIDIDVLVDQSVSKKVGQRGSATNRALRQSFGTSERLIGR